MDGIAENYVKLILEVGLYDPDYVDAYYGPPEWRPPAESKAEAFPYTRLSEKADALSAATQNIAPETLDAPLRQRRAFLLKQLTAVKTKIEMLNGKVLTFDEESRLLYDAVAPSHDAQYFESVLQKLDAALPGTGDITVRLTDFKKDFIIPKEKLDAVFQAAIDACRKRTLAFIELPEDEDFKVEYVSDQPWGAYNWYQGNSFSLIQVNTDLPIYIDRAVDLAAHEGYPGHHVYNALLENKLVVEQGWVEFSVYPLFSPQSLIAEGSANYGIEMVFPGQEQIEFEKEVLFPLAGLAPNTARRFYEVKQLTTALGYARNQAARNYLDGTMNESEAIAWMTRYSLQPEERARKSLQFIDRYRSYVINYNLGQDIVKDFVARNSGGADQIEKRWQVFKELLSTPQTASSLIATSPAGENAP